jgi:hypothetical protein
VRCRWSSEAPRPRVRKSRTSPTRLPGAPEHDARPHRDRCQEQAGAATDGDLRTTAATLAQVVDYARMGIRRRCPNPSGNARSSCRGIGPRRLTAAHRLWAGLDPGRQRGPCAGRNRRLVTAVSRRLTAVPGTFSTWAPGLLACPWPMAGHPPATDYGRTADEQVRLNLEMSGRYVSAGVSRRIPGGGTPAAAVKCHGPERTRGLARLGRGPALLEDR